MTTGDEAPGPDDEHGSRLGHNRTARSLRALFEVAGETLMEVQERDPLRCDGDARHLGGERAAALQPGVTCLLAFADPGHWRAYTTDPEMLGYLRDGFRSSGAFRLGFSIVAIVVSVRWFRAGDPVLWLVAVTALLSSRPRAGARP